MANSLKELMGLSQGELMAMSAQYGLTFHTGMRKSDMAKQLQSSAASGWMEVNSQLMAGVEGGHEESNNSLMFEGHDLISDAAHVAQIISGAGFTETFHAAMNGPSHHVEAVHAYLDSLGVSSDDVWMHMPKANPNMPPKHFGSMNAYMRDNLTKHQDIMQEIPGHYSGNIMDEYATNKGGLQSSYEYLAHMYVDKSQYDSHSRYTHDLQSVTSRLQSQMGGRFAEVAASSAMGAHVSYAQALPQIGDPSIVAGVQSPRMALNASGLPLGSFGAGINSEYSLSASLTGQTGWSDASKAVYSDVSDAAKSLAKVYTGGSERGMNPRRPELSDLKTSLLDAASRYIDPIDARSNYDILDNPTASRETLERIVKGWDDYDFAPANPIAPSVSSYAEQARYHDTGPGRSFTTDFNEPTSWNSARSRREWKAIADLDAASSNYTAPDDSNTGSSSGPKFHNLGGQGSDEWLAFRQGYDITGSTVGGFLGHNRYTSPVKEMSDRIGFRGPMAQNADMARGHRLEPIARSRVASQFGFDIQEADAITNADFPRMMYSPDGLIGDDAIWEHKAPRKFFNLEDHQDYVDQMQLGMTLSGRNRALFSQTVGNETRSQWVERDPDWFENNQNKLMSTMARMDAGRQFVAENSNLTQEELKAGARAAMTGDGIWGFQNQTSGNDYYTAGKRGMSRFSQSAGTDNDPFIRSAGTAASSAPDADFSGSQTSMALSVKEGILAAQEENRQKRQSGGGDLASDIDPFSPQRQNADEAFDRMMNPLRYNYGGGGQGGGGGGGSQPPSWFTGGNAGGDFVRGLSGGTIDSVSGGAKAALMRTPWGMAATAAYGAMTALNEGAENVNEYIGQAEDAGLINPNEYSGMTMGMQQLGLSESQATRINATTHSAFNTLLNGDPSGAIRIVQGTRGLLNIGDIREAQGDPVRLAAIAKQRAEERGWSQQRFAGAMQMAGLDGMARAGNRSDYAHGLAGDTVQAGRDSDYAEGIAANDTLQANRADINVERFALSTAVSQGAPVMNAGRDAIIETRSGVNSISNGIRSVYDFIAGEESGGNPNARSTTSTAYGSMQTLDGTRRDPGFGVRPAQDNSPEEAARVGRDYYDAMVRRYNDPRKAMAAYTDGPGTVDSAIKQYGEDWLNHMPAQAQKRVSKYDEWSAKGNSAHEGADGFTRNGTSYGQAPINVNVNVNAKVNNQMASASATVNGQSATVVQNMNNGANQRR